MSQTQRKRSLPGLVLVLAMAPPTAAQGQEPVGSGLNTVVVVTASRQEELLVNAPATMTVLSGKALERMPGSSVADWLRAVPGLNVSQTSVRDVNLNARAATGSLTDSQLALLDGRSIYQDFFGFVLWDLFPVNRDEIEQIEIIRGPASAVWGANALNGVVNVITKPPRAMLGTTVTFEFGQFDRAVGSSDVSSGGLLSIRATHAQAPSDRLAFKVSTGLLAQEAYPRPAGNVPRTSIPYPSYLNTGTRQPRFDARLDYQLPGDRRELIVAGGVSGTSGIAHTGLGPFAVQTGTRLGYGKVAYRHDRLKLQFFANLLNGDSLASLARTGDGRPLRFKVDNQSYDVELSNSHVLGTQHLLSYGGNYRHNAFQLSIAPRGDNRDEGGLYIQDDIFISERFRWMVGGRVDRFDVLAKAVFSPRTAFMVKPSRTQTFRVSFNRAFRAPSFVNSFLDVSLADQLDLATLDPRWEGQTFPFAYRAVGNDALTEGGITAYEAGWVGGFGRATLSATAYVNHTRNMILFAQSGSYTSANPPAGWPLPPAVLDDLIAGGVGLPSEFTYLNFARVTDRGTELALELETTRDVTAFVNYSWQDAPVGHGFGTNELNIAPTHRMNVGVSGERGRYFGTVSLHYVGDAFWQDVLDTRFHGWTEAYALVNGALGVRSPDGSMMVSVSTTNLFNREVQQHVFGDVIKRTITGAVQFKF